MYTATCLRGRILGVVAVLVVVRRVEAHVVVLALLALLVLVLFRLMSGAATLGEQPLALCQQRRHRQRRPEVIIHGARVAERQGACAEVGKARLKETRHSLGEAVHQHEACGCIPLRCEPHQQDAGGTALCSSSLLFLLVGSSI